MSIIDKNNPDKYWEDLSNIPCTDDGDIEEKFLHFEVGTDREEIWHWFEDYFNITIGDKYF